MTDQHAARAVVDLLAEQGSGPVWGMASADLNATLLAWPPGHEVAEHVNTEVDVLLIVLEGGGLVVVDQLEHALAPGHAVLIAQGSTRTIHAGTAGLRYLSVHRRRGPLQLSSDLPQARS